MLALPASAFIRGPRNTKDVTRMKGTSDVMKQQEKAHNGLQPNCICTLKGTYQQTLKRYVTEALTLDRFARTHRVMNKRS